MPFSPSLIHNLPLEGRQYSTISGKSLVLRPKTVIIISVFLPDWRMILYLRFFHCVVLLKEHKIIQIYTN